MHKGKRILIIEDEAMISMVLEDILDLLGYQVAGIASNLPEARSRCQDGGFDAVILDVHLHGQDSYGLADQLKAEGKRVIFATGTSRENLPSRFQSGYIIEKPYVINMIESVLDEALAA